MNQKSGLIFTIITLFAGDDAQILHTKSPVKRRGFLLQVMA